MNWIGIFNTFFSSKASSQVTGALSFWKNRVNPCAVPATNAGLYAWGRNDYGQLGLGHTDDRYCPVQIGTLNDWSSLSAGEGAAFAVKSTGTLWGWGDNFVGLLGVNTASNTYSSPVQVGTLNTWSHISVSKNYQANAMGIRGGGLWMWGSASGYGADPPYGRLGKNDTNPYSSPIQLGALTTWTKVEVGLWHAHAIKGGQLWGWGNNFWNKLGVISGDTSSPIQVGAATDWIAITTASSSSLGIRGTTSGSLWAWGSNSSGVLGVGSTANKSSPTQVGALTTWTKVVSASYSVLALRSDNSLWAWGANSSGQLGLGDISSRSSPVLVGTLWKDISISTTHSVGLKTNNTLWTWGSNYYGQLGQQNTTSSLWPVQVGTLATWSKIAAGTATSFAIKSAN